MDQTPSKSIDQRRIDQNNNCSSNKSNSSEKSCTCSCTNISIMQLFHEMKQEFPKVPDHIVQQLVTENCHNRRACLEQLQKVLTSSPTTPTMYPSKIIHNNSNDSTKSQQTLRSPMNGFKTGSSQKMREMTERFENTSISSSSASTTSNSSNVKIKRPSTLPLRPAPDPPVSNNNQRSPQSTLSTPNSTTSVSSFSTSTSQQQPSQQTHHNVVLDSTASKINDSLNVQLNVKVSPISTKRPAPPPPTRKFTSHLSVQPEPPYTSMLDQRNNNLMPLGGASASTGTFNNQRSYTNVKLTLRQPSASLTPIDIQAGPQTLSYSSSSFNAQQGCESHLKITVAGNGESCIQAVRTAKNAPDINQIDTTINIEGNYLMNDDMKSSQQYRIVTNNPYSLQPQQQLALPQSKNRLTEDELRQLIRRQIKQKELLESELEKEREKLQMIRLDIITLTTPIMTQIELRELCDELKRLRTVCGKISDEIDVVTDPHPSQRAITSAASSPSAPPPIPKGLVSRKSHSPSNSLLPHLDSITQPPSYNEAIAMRETDRRRDVNSISNVIEEKWTCTICTFQNHHLMDICETCEMPRVSGIRITSSSFRPLLENNHLQGASVPTNDNNTNNNNSVIQATAL